MTPRAWPWKEEAMSMSGSSCVPQPQCPPVEWFVLECGKERWRKR